MGSASLELVSFNPIYAQGMTVVAMTAVALDRDLAEHRRRSGEDLAGFARRFQRRVATTNAGAWTMATSEDLRYPWTEGARLSLPTRIMHRYADRVLEVANGNPQVNTAFVNMVNLATRRRHCFIPWFCFPCWPGVGPHSSPAHQRRGERTPRGPDRQPRTIESSRLMTSFPLVQQRPVAVQLQA